MKKLSDQELRMMAMKLAIQHSKNCHYKTLIQLAGHIYDFITGKKMKDDKFE